MAPRSSTTHRHQLAHARADRALVLILADDPAAPLVVETVAAYRYGGHLALPDRLGEFQELGLQNLGAMAKLAEHEAKIILARPPVHHPTLEQVNLS